MNRRDLMRLTAVAAGAMAGGRQPNRVDAGQEASPVAEAGIALDLRGGDVWAWEKRLTGTCRGCPPEAIIALRVNDDPVLAERDGDAFAATVRLRPGENRIVAVAVHPDGSEESSEAVGHTVKLEPRPTARLTVRVEGRTVTFDGTGSTPSAYDGSPIVRWEWALGEENPEPLHLVEEDGALHSAPVPTTDGEYFFRLTVGDEQGRQDTAGTYFVVENGRAWAADPLVEEAAWTAPATVYGVIARNFEGANFQGVTDRLDDLRDLGVAALWMAPITKAIRDYFGYEVLDYFNVRESYGTLDDFRRLVDEAHARGIRVLLDFVPNHTSVEHPYFLDAQAHGTASPYYDFYNRDDGGNYTYCFNYSHLANLNLDNAEVRRFMIEAFSFWVREYDVDGFRVDVAWGIKERKPELWLEWNAELNRIKPDCLLIAEASARDPYYFDNGFDAAYDWTDELGHWAWGDAFADIAPMSRVMREVLTNEPAGYHPDALIFRFLNNNDTGARFISSYGVDFYRVAAAMLLTLPGLPCIYTGDEVGAEFLPYGQLGPIDWTDRHGLRDHFKKLVALRRDLSSLHSRHWTPLDVEPLANLFGYLRHGDEGDPPVAVLLNFTGDEVEATVPVPAAYASMTASGTLNDLWHAEQVTVSGTGSFTVPVPAWGTRILVGDDVT